MSRLTWPDLLIEDITPEQFRAWIAPWAGVIGGSVAPAFLNKFAIGQRVRVILNDRNRTPHEGGA
jgi:hypothetical protein